MEYKLDITGLFDMQKRSMCCYSAAVVVLVAQDLIAVISN